MGGAEKFLAVFGRPARLLACECERSSETTLGQAFQLISGPEMNEMLTNPENRLAALSAPGHPTAAAVEELYWTALSRPPSEAEARAAAQAVGRAGSVRAGLEDVAWALLNAKEYVLRK